MVVAGSFFKTTYPILVLGLVCKTMLIPVRFWLLSLNRNFYDILHYLRSTASNKSGFSMGTETPHSMRGRVFGQAVKPDKIEYEVTIRLEIADWKLLIQSLSESGKNTRYPEWHVIEGIKKVIVQAESSYFQPIETE